MRTNLKAERISANAVSLRFILWNSIAAPVLFRFRGQKATLLTVFLCCGLFPQAPTFALASIPYSEGWQRHTVALKNDNVTVITPGSMSNDLPRLQWLIQIADRSTVTSSPINSNLNGLFDPGDVFVVTPDLLLWFNCRSPHGTTTNGGAGLLRGLWPLHIDGSGKRNFKRITNGSNYSPNMLYPGSAPGLQGSGISLLGNFGTRNVDNGVTFALEHDQTNTVTEMTGTAIAEGQHAGGVYVQFSGLLANSNIRQADLQRLGLHDQYDCDARPDKTGRCTYTLTYRISAIGSHFRQEISLNVIQNNLGPCATMVLSHNLAGYPNQPVTLVSDAKLQRNGIARDSSAYSSLDGQNLYFYTLPWQPRPGKVRWWPTPVGQGTVAGVGNPNSPHLVPFITYRPAIDRLPSFSQKSYVLQAIDNQAADSPHRCLALDLQLWDVNRGSDHQTFPKGSVIHIVTDYAMHSAPESDL